MVYCIALHYSYLRRTTETCTTLKVLTDVGASMIFDLEKKLSMPKIKKKCLSQGHESTIKVIWSWH